MKSTISMKKLLTGVCLALGLSGNVHAVSVLGDLVNFTNYTATFTKIVDVGELTSFSLQVVESTATQPGITQADMSKIDTIGNLIISSASYGLGQPILFSTTVAGATMPTGLVWGTTYFAIPTSESYFKVSDTSTGSVAGVFLVITGTSTTTLITMTPLTLNMGTASMSFDASNDGTNFSTVGSSVTLSTVGSGNQLRDFGAYAYKFLRLTYTGVTAGTLRLRAYISGRRAG